MAVLLEQPRTGKSGQPAEADRPGEERDEPDRHQHSGDLPGQPEDALASPVRCGEDWLRLLMLDGPHA